MAKRETWYVANKDMTLAGRKVTKGQLVKPEGFANDHKIYGDRTPYTYRYDGTDPLTCGTDGCDTQCINLGALDRHREVVHKPERDERERARAAALEAAKEREERGESIGGHEIVTEKSGPGGRVPYIKNPMTA